MEGYITQFSALCTTLNAKHSDVMLYKKRNQKQVHPRTIDSPNLPREARVKVALDANLLLRHLRRRSARASMLNSTSRTCINFRA
jgi:hypothetical protein